MTIRFEQLFSVKKPIIGMIHLSGRDDNEKINRALEELALYEEEGVNGAIIENYHGSTYNVKEVLKASYNRFPNLIKGVNTLTDLTLGFFLAHEYGANFVQIDSVQTNHLNAPKYDAIRDEFPNIVVLGGIGFKYTSPSNQPLETELIEGKSRCEAIVTTGSGTGKETPIDKLRLYKSLLSDFPLIVGAGVNGKNAYTQLEIVDGAIVGSYFKKDSNTENMIDRSKVREIMEIAKRLRTN